MNTSITENDAVGFIADTSKLFAEKNSQAQMLSIYNKK